jgi:arginine:pyruvate transaminase
MPGSSFGAQARNLIRLSLTVPDDVLASAVQRMTVLTAVLAAERSRK